MVSTTERQINNMEKGQIVISNKYGAIVEVLLLVGNDGFYGKVKEVFNYGIGYTKNEDYFFFNNYFMDYNEYLEYENKKQVGGNHYNNKAIQPIKYILANNMNFCEGNVIKYITRYKEKNGIEDLKKAKQYIDFLINQYESKKDI